MLFYTLLIVLAIICCPITWILIYLLICIHEIETSIIPTKVYPDQADTYALIRYYTDPDNTKDMDPAQLRLILNALTHRLSDNTDG